MSSTRCSDRPKRNAISSSGNLSISRRRSTNACRSDTGVTRVFIGGVASERELLARLPERLDYLWFLGYELENPIPDHSVLSKARSRWGRAVFEQFFVRTVAQCVAAGL